MSAPVAFPRKMGKAARETPFDSLLLPCKTIKPAQAPTPQGLLFLRNSVYSNRSQDFMGLSTPRSGRSVAAGVAGSRQRFRRGAAFLSTSVVRTW